VKDYLKLLPGVLLAGVLQGWVPAALAGQVDNHTFETNVNVAVLPFAELSIVGSNVLSLTIPPAGSTIPSSGVKFLVMGNASATMTAAPSDFIQIGSQFLGKAVKGSDQIGYNLELRFPSVGAPGSPKAAAGLPGFEAAPSYPPLTVNLATTGNQRAGEIHLEADPNWTPSGGIPMPGTYLGQIVLTLVAS
jgi:hypothetical protein